MIIDTVYDNREKKLTVSYVNNNNKIALKQFLWQNPKEWVACDNEDYEAHPVYRSWDGKNIKQVSANYPSRYSIYDFLDTKITEKEREELFRYKEPDIFFVDIETEKTEDGYSDAKIADNRILTISIVYADKIVLYGLKDLSKEAIQDIKEKTNKYFEKFDTEYKVKYVKFDTEFDMLYEFFYKAVPKMDLITGWNFTNYDWLYLINRARKVKRINHDGREISINPSVTSPSRRLIRKHGTEIEFPQHRIIFDYMQLFKILDTSIKVKESNKLDYVGEKLVGVPKIAYNGSLQDLYDNDFEKFMLYNAVDSVLVQRIHLARNYVSIIYAIASLAKIKLTDCISYINDNLGTLAITEGVLRNRFRTDNIILFKDEENRVSVENVKSITGGFVKDPITGMNRWVAVYDFASLYPTTQLEWYIAPENYKGDITKDYTIYKDMNATIVGSSYQAMDTAFIMANMCKKVTLLVDNKDEFEELKKDELYKRIIRRGIDIQYNDVTFVNGTHCVESLLLSDNTELESDVVFFIRDIEKSSNLYKSFVYLDKNGNKKGKFGIKIKPNGFVTDKGIVVNTREYVVCINGCVFYKKKSPTLQMLSEVYSDRKSNKKLMMIAKEKVDKLKHYLSEIDLLIENV
jgi:DNA polymerase elongation subunit (family B)